ncbi:hypothetical protein SCLCIDRAFT_18893 [Scleroderma citrinum Foug A]|uniref:Fungal-type protein kinase domain-containing protein n=1 Tax=Scleroderma citrinum Foug A TaxID=1036808 RepID=A0A0C3EE23_9AGAM|nr:hypothetical protein SCLCIDRAFT_18893 [Scleroderma citrinum Foug A]
MELVGTPLSEFKTIHELLSILIDILDTHMTLFEKFRILHHDISINNTMIYVADIPESEGNKDEGCSGGSSNGGRPQKDNGGLHHPEALGNEAVDTQEDKHAQWDRERWQQI